MKDAFNIVPMHYDDDGMPIWKSMLSPTSNTQRALVLAPPNKVIPILFVPGIMGSNLKTINSLKADKQEIAWRPDFAAAGDIFRDPAARQRLLDPTNTKVDSAVTVNKKTKVVPLAGMSLAAAEKRGWGSVMWASYGEILHYLEQHFNGPVFYESNLKKVLVSAIWQPLIQRGVVTINNGAYKLTQDELEHMSEYWFPVHAVGYNWLQSNEDSGIYLAKQIEEIKTLYQKKFKNDRACEKVILVTHSMGGLVARAALHPDMGSAEAKVLGVIHGVMPAIGAGATYTQLRTGVDSDGSGPLGLLGWAAKQVIGASGQEVTAVVAHSRGGLQLLPNKTYTPDGWLKVEGITGIPYVIPMSKNPYKTIYAEKNKWWRMVHPDWLDPAGKFDNPDVAWTSYIQNIANAEQFHDKLVEQYHPQSYVYYGDDKKHPSYGEVTWKKVGWFDENITDSFNNQGTKEALMRNGLAHEQWDNSRGVTAAVLGKSHATFQLLGPRDAGDGTVPSISGKAPELSNATNVKFECGISGITHQGSYAVKNSSVMHFVFYSACKIVKEMV
jgi:pimeloyl-ACP methyl ester carboxylesterase